MYRKFANTENLQVQLVQRLLLPEPSECNFPVWCPTTPKHISTHSVHTKTFSYTTTIQSIKMRKLIMIHYHHLGFGTHTWVKFPRFSMLFFRREDLVQKHVLPCLQAPSFWNSYSVCLWFSQLWYFGSYRHDI